MILQEGLVGAPVDLEVDDADELLVFVSHGEKFESANHQFKFLLLACPVQNLRHFL